MKLEKYLTLTALLLAGFSYSNAQRSLEEMKAIAIREFTMTQQVTKGVQSPSSVPELSVAMNSPELAVFNKSDGGWVMVSANGGTVSDVLAYSLDGRFDWESAPDNIRDWIEGYEEQIRSLSGISTPVSAAIWHGKVVVGPLVQSKWSQDSPYNNLCPMDSSYSLNGWKYQRSVVGCVATAMAQIMNYWEWPVRGTGSHSDLSDWTVTADFGTYYDWDNILDAYSLLHPYNSTQSDAVAKLCYDCGVAVDMMYSSSGSGALTDDVPSALCAYFGYSTDARFIIRDDYQGDWDALIKGELNARRPVLYCGRTPDSGHAFICDGYDDKDYYHFNFGWGGDSDGYYKLSAINTSLTSRYNDYHHVVVGIHPSGESDKAVWKDGLCFMRTGEHEAVLLAVDGNGTLERLATPEYVVINSDTCLIRIEAEQFMNNPVLCEVSLSGVESIGSTCFEDCSRLKSLNLGDELKSVTSHSFSYCFELDTITFGKSLKKIEQWAFYGCESLRHLVFSDNIEIIEDHAFSYIDSLKTLRLSKSLESIGDWAFDDCKSLQSIDFGESLSEIGTWAFSYCKSLENLSFPNSLCKIDVYAFIGCDSLRTVHFGSGLETIGNHAFAQCPLLDTVYCMAPEPPVCTDGADAFWQSHDLATATLYVPDGCVAKYSTAPGWCEFGSILEYDQTSVDEVQAKPRKAPAYNLMGQPVDGVYHGIVIQEGHKFLR